VSVHTPENALCSGMALVGQRTQKPKGGCVVAPFNCSKRIVKRASGHGQSKGRYQDEAKGNRPERTCHGSSSPKPLRGALMLHPLLWFSPGVCPHEWTTARAASAPAEVSSGSRGHVPPASSHAGRTEVC